MKELFSIDQTYHSNGSVIFKWQPGGNFLATAGSNGLVHIFDRHGKQVDEVSLRSSQPVLDLCWDYVGESLAVLQQGNGEACCNRAQPEYKISDCSALKEHDFGIKKFARL